MDWRHAGIARSYCIYVIRKGGGKMINQPSKDIFSALGHVDPEHFRLCFHCWKLQIFLHNFDQSAESIWNRTALRFMFFSSLQLIVAFHLIELKVGSICLKWPLDSLIRIKLAERLTVSKAAPSLRPTSKHNLLRACFLQIVPSNIWENRCDVSRQKITQNFGYYPFNQFHQILTTRDKCT